MNLADTYAFTGTVSGAGGGIFESQLLHVRDEKSQNTASQSISAGNNVRDLNTIKTNEITGASLSSNQITLPAGTYFIQARQSLINTGNSQSKLKNATDNSDIFRGSSMNVGTSEDKPHDTWLFGRFTLASSKAIEVIAQTEFAGNGGSRTNLGTEVYTDVQIWKVA
jgi:hypothetical protein